MNAVRQISRRFGRVTETRTRSAVDYSITATLSVVPDPLKLNETACPEEIVPGQNGWIVSNECELADVLDELLGGLKS